MHILTDAALAQPPFPPIGDDGRALYVRGLLALRNGDAEEAVSLLIQALRRQPANPGMRRNLVRALLVTERYEQVVSQANAALAGSPDDGELHFARGTALNALGQHASACSAFSRALSLQPNHAASWLNMGDASADLDDFVAAETLYRQFARYLPLIRAAGGVPILVCSPALVRLIQSIPGVQAIASSKPLPAHDAWIDQGSLAHAFGTTLETIPAPDSYLQADSVRVKAWRMRLPGGRKVGVVFTGNPKHPADRRRSVPLELIGKLPDIPGLSFVNLHHGEAAGGLRLPDLTPWLTDYAETAALIENLDLVVTVDTSIAHLAGALGKKVWILLPHEPDWRWLLDRTDSLWYRSARLFRQPASGDWASVLTQVMREIEQHPIETGSR